VAAKWVPEVEERDAPRARRAAAPEWVAGAPHLSSMHEPLDRSCFQVPTKLTKVSLLVSRSVRHCLCSWSHEVYLSWCGPGCFVVVVAPVRGRVARGAGLEAARPWSISKSASGDLKRAGVRRRISSTSPAAAMIAHTVPCRG
jgi:hypothetical protein